MPAAFTRAASAPEASALDVTVLTDLVGDDPKIVRDFLGHFQTSAQRLANELRGFRATDDLRQIGAVAHKLRSSSRSVGALVLGDLCAELENSCRTGTRESILQGMVRFEAALLEVDAKIEDLLVVA